MGTNTTCPNCGGPLPQHGILEALCPACLLAGESERGYLNQGLYSPEVEQLRASFPELEIFEPVGRGGSGVVYRARQARLDRLVALKVFDSKMSGQDSFAARFLREARALARLDHPAIVGVHDFGERDGTFYLLMEYVDGVSLRERLNAKDLAHIIHENADQTPRTAGIAGLLPPAGTLRKLASSTTLQGRLRGQCPQSTSRSQFEAFCLAVHE